MTTIIINPGTGPVDGVLLRLAWTAARNLRRDLQLFERTDRDDQPIPWREVDIKRASKIDEAGRYGFVFSRGKKRCDVEIPGLSIDRVRYTGTGGQNPWGFPRLYVDGSSWLWMFAVSSVREALS